MEKRTPNTFLTLLALVLICGGIAIAITWADTLRVTGRLGSHAVQPTAAPTQDAQWVSRDGYGDNWPFTVDAGRAFCVPLDDGRRLALFEAAGVLYALNGTARSVSGERGYADIDTIWRDDPGMPGAKINIGPILNTALDDCN